MSSWGYATVENPSSSADVKEPAAYQKFAIDFVLAPDLFCRGVYYAYDISITGDYEEKSTQIVRKHDFC
jgi:hypothetical protein